MWLKSLLLLLCALPLRASFITNPGGTSVSSSTLPGGSTQYINNQSTLQSGAVFHVASGTVAGQLSPTTIRFPDGTVQVSSPPASSSSLSNNSTHYIQNTLTPTTTTQKFAVQVGSFSVAGWYIMDADNCMWQTTIDTSGELQTNQISCPPVSGFSYQRVLTVDHTKVGTTSLTYSDFPVLVSTNDVTLSTNIAGGHLVTGYDLVFSTMSDCSYNLYWDTETVNNTGSATMNTWVKLPSISSSTDTTFFMCYGKADITTYQGRSTGTWDSNFKAVWHFGDGTTLNLKDSTNNGNQGTIVGSTATVGKIGGAILTGESAYATFPPVTATATYTLNTWFKTSADYQSLGHYGGLIDAFNGGTTRNYGYIIDKGALFFPNGIEYTFQDNGGGSHSGGNFATINNGAWHLAQYAFTAGGGVIPFYVDNVYQANVTDSSASPAAAPSGLIGVGDIPGAPDNEFIGSIDEIRISATARSLGWLTTEWNNQNSPATFLSIGSETPGP